jgi:hypothetical protein
LKRGGIKSRSLAGGAIIAGLYGIAPGAAQPNLETLIARSSVTARGACVVLDIGLHLPFRYVGSLPRVSSLPNSASDQVVIRLQPSGVAAGAIPKGRETFPGPPGATDRFVSIEYDGEGDGGPSLSLFFAKKEFFRIAQTTDFRRLFVAISGESPDAACVPRPMAEARPASQTSPGPPADMPGLVPDGAPGDDLEQARAAIMARDYETAIRLLTRLLRKPEGEAGMEAQELLGVTRERNGQLAHAKAEYEEYLRRYPVGESADRVRQRLSGLLTSEFNRQTSAARRGAGARPRAGGPVPSQSPWSLRGSVSEYFYHDQMTTRIEDDITHVVIDNGITAVQTQLVSALDVELGVRTSSLYGRFRAVAAQTSDFLSSRTDRAQVSQIFLEAGNTDQSLITRIGRQYRSAAGMIGRFDGVVLSYQPWEHIRAEFMGGFPVDGSRAPFATNRRAIGASVSYLNGPWNADLYALRQTDHGILDRQSVGAEARYIGADTSVIGSLDYDLHFGEINAGIVSGSQTLPTRTVLNFSFDYRRAPLLRTSNALIGQPAQGLDGLLATYSLAEIQQLALDRSGKSTSLMFGAMQPFGERFSLGVDATYWTLSSMPGSGGVAAVPSMGTESYYSAHLIGTSLFMEGDLTAANFGFAQSFNANRYSFDLNTRFPLSRSLRIGPRLVTSYRQTTDTPSTRYIVRPSLRTTYRIFPNLELEFEGGAEWERLNRGTTSTRTWNFIVNAGTRLTF